MKVSIDILYLVMASFGVIGLIEWIKSLIAAIEKIGKDKADWKALAWVCLSFVLAFGVAAAGDGGIFQILSNGIFILAINEIVGYNVIVKTVFALIDKLTGSMSLPPSIVEKAQEAVEKFSEPPAKDGV